VNYACHPVILGWDNLKYSADYTGELCRIVKAETGAECLFIQGGAGDINPYLDKMPIAKGGIEAMRDAGKTCADAVLEAFGKIDSAGTENASLGFVQKMVTVGTRWNFQDPEVAKVFRAAYGDYFEHYMAKTPHDLAVPLAVLLINNELAIAAMSGECFVQLQLDLKAGSPVKKTIMAAFSNDYHAYIPDIKGAAHGNYGGAVATFVGLGAGEKLVAEAHIETGKLAGMIRDKMEPADFVLKQIDPSPF
jgi:neutral ceramidase